MIDQNTFRPIPSYPDFLASRFGNIHHKKNLNALSQMCTNGYLFVQIDDGYQPTTFSRRMNHRGKMVVRKKTKKFKRVAVHRLVAEAWLGKPEGDRDVVNHRDGNSLNNTPDNLEWCNHKENLRHAMLTGLSPYELREESSECRVRDFETGKVHYFTSISEAKHFMNVPIATLTSQLNPIRFGVLLSERYEFRLTGDNRPWFYENRTKKVEAKYIVECAFEDGTVREIFNMKDWWEVFPSLPKSLSSFKICFHRAVREFPRVSFKFRDAYEEDPYKRIRAYKRIKRGGIYLFDFENKTTTLYANVADAAAIVGCGEKTFRFVIRAMKIYRGRWMAAREFDEDSVQFIKDNYHF